MLLVAVDIEGCASEVVDVVGKLALELGEPVTLIYAGSVPESVPYDTVLPGKGKTVEDMVRYESKNALQALADPWIDRGVEVTVKVEIGSPQEVVLATTEALLPRMLVLGTHGRTGVSRWVFGSVEEKITRRSPVPVLVIPAGAGMIDQPTAVHQRLCAETDG